MKKKKAVKPRTSAGGKDPVLKYAKTVIFRQGDNGELVIMDVSNADHYFKVDALAAEFWKSIDGKKTVSELVLKLQKKSTLDKKAIAKEAARLVKSLLSAKLVELV